MNALSASLALAALAGFCRAPALAADPSQGQAAFEEANRLFEQSRLEDAVRAYRTLIPRNERSADLHYNLGNAYFRLGQPGSLALAIASYQRAFAIRPRDPDIRANLDLALRRAGEGLVPSGTPTALFVVFHLLSQRELAAAQYAALWGFCALACAFLLQPRLRRRLRAPLAAAAALWLVCGSWWALRSLALPDSPAVILVQGAEVRSGPGDSFPVSFKSPEGRRVSVLESKGQWLEIGVLKEGLRGWIPADAVERI